MAEADAESISNVYDLIYPSPISLKKISAIVVCVEYWREEIYAHLEMRRLHELDLKNNIQLENILPNLPSTIYSLLEPYANTFRKSLLQWLDDHDRYRVFPSYSTSPINIFSRFQDFTWDWDGTIHEVRTAKRMMICERLDCDVKFKIACFYCFEEDVKRIWPSVSANMNLDAIDFDTCPQQYYWICYLRNELYKVPNPGEQSIDEVMMLEYDLDEYNHTYVDYFWDRLPSDRQLQITIDNFHAWPKYFTRFILPKLSKHQLEAFLDAKGAKLMQYLLSYVLEPRPFGGIATWMYIRNKINTSNFIMFINNLLVPRNISDSDVCFMRMAYSFRDTWENARQHLFCEIWENTPQHLKRSALNFVLMLEYPLFLSRLRSKCTGFLITVLQDATFKERSVFWHKNWQNLIYGALVEDLRELMKLCFRNENEITLFKENAMSRYENIAKWCVSLLAYGSFNDLDGFLSFCCLDVQKRRELKRQLLWSNFFGESNVLTTDVIKNNKSLNEFIDDAFQDAADLGVEFKNQWTSSPETQSLLLECIDRGLFTSLMEFFDTFYGDRDGHVEAPLRKRLIQAFSKRLYVSGMRCMKSDNAQRFLRWVTNELIKPSD